MSQTCMTSQHQINQLPFHLPLIPLQPFLSSPTQPKENSLQLSPRSRPPGSWAGPAASGWWPPGSSPERTPCCTPAASPVAAWPRSHGPVPAAASVARTAPVPGRLWGLAKVEPPGNMKTRCKEERINISYNKEL